MIKTFTKTALIAVLAGVASNASAGIIAYNADGAPFVEVSAAGLDLNSAAGVATLTDRVRRVAHIVCDTGSTDLGMVMKEKACFDRSFGEAQDKIATMRLQSAQRAGGERPVQTADSRTPR